MNKLIPVSLAILMLNGCGGSAGPAGPAGPAGTNGLNGSSAGLSSVTYCQKIDSGIGASLLYEYEIGVLASGDVFVSCVLSGANSQSSGSSMFKSSQVGSSTAGCNVTADINSDNQGGYWAFTTSGSTHSVTYHDPSQAHDGYTYTFAAGDCSTH